ncbi:exostosin family protein [Striga asiatica]|uniref:Exostosin family protein n=1 Tax=Striga asiatica TaxID=4170 RepID=A0A5A7PUU4_STRAF|nr:exostosin family protein [Striga asiatica]
MAAATAVFSLLFTFLPPLLSAAQPTPYLSPVAFLRDYQNMLSSFKIFIYAPTKPFNFPGGPSALFYGSLLRSPFLTGDPEEAHLYLVPFSPGTPTRSLARVVREIRNNFPYWNRTLGADHFFVSPAGITFSSDRNVLELKKNSVQISDFPVVSGNFVPHKDIALPPAGKIEIGEAAEKLPPETRFLGYLNWDGETRSDLVSELAADSDFLIDEKPEPEIYARGVRASRFCLFFHGGAAPRLAEAMATGCVPVVLVDRPVQDLPFMDVLRWSDMAVVARVPAGGGGRLRELLGGLSEERYSEMRGLCAAASRHLVWNEEPRPLDAFHVVMYQLWARRHAVRYARREFV